MPSKKGQSFLFQSREICFFRLFFLLREGGRFLRVSFCFFYYGKVGGFYGFLSVFSITGRWELFTSFLAMCDIFALFFFVIFEMHNLFLYDDFLTCFL